MGRKNQRSAKSHREGAKHRCLPRLQAAPSPLLFYSAIHRLLHICLLELYAQLSLLPVAVCQGVPTAFNSGPVPSSTALQFSTREQGRLDGDRKSLQRRKLSHFQSYSSTQTCYCPLPRAQAPAKPYWHARTSERVHAKSHPKSVLRCFSCGHIHKPA